MDLKIYSDGGARGNPGPASAAAFVFNAENNDLLKFDADYLGNSTNNQAEYEALILGLKIAERLAGENIECFLDSELIVKQLNGEYRVKDDKMKILKKKVDAVSGSFKSIRFIHIPREKNKFADSLVNLILDSAGK
ncbi:ribonuclease HI family protein [Candidatus Dojkabacteria bacterium]|nr:ribonuclease HI family protein [Candidatus Dojkabacteria bacterium]